VDELVNELLVALVEEVEVDREVVDEVVVCDL